MIHYQVLPCVLYILFRFISYRSVYLQDDCNCSLGKGEDVYDAHGYLAVSGTNCLLFVNKAECNGLYLLSPS